MQDRDDDIRIGVKSTAVRWGDNTTKWIAFFSGSTVFFLSLAGYAGGMEWPYFLALGLTGVQFGKYVFKTNLKDAMMCKKAFESNNDIGALVLLAILGSTALQKTSSKTDERVDQHLAE